MTASQARFASLTIWHGNAWLKKSFSQLQKLCPIIIEGGVVARRLGCAAQPFTPWSGEALKWRTSAPITDEA
jgi:hypothetical protein